MFAKTPSSYLGISEPYLACAVDLACAAAVWTDDSTQMAKSEEKAGAESILRGQELAKFREELTGR